MEFQNADPGTYASDLEAALAALEQAVLERYHRELDDRHQVWTPYGGTVPDPYPLANGGPGPDVVGITFNNLREYAPGWAADVVNYVRAFIPDYDVQDLSNVESAWDDFVRVQEQCDAGTLATLVDDLQTNSADSDDFDKWAGISRHAYRDRFADYVDKTLKNHRDIAASLANLYSGRGGLVETGRSRTLAAIHEAVEQLEAQVPSGAEGARWLVIGIGAIVVSVATAGVATPAAAAIAIGTGGVTTVGGYLDSADPDMEPAHELEPVVRGLTDSLRITTNNLHSDESDWSGKVRSLQDEIAAADSNVLELNDFSGYGSGEDAPPTGGFTVDGDYIIALANQCFEASHKYEALISSILASESADGDLKGINNAVTTGDAELIDTRNTFVSFLRTTCARYYEAGNRLVATAKIYYGVEVENAEAAGWLDRAPDFNGSAPGRGGDVDGRIEDTDRSDIENWPEPMPPWHGGGGPTPY